MPVTFRRISGITGNGHNMKNIKILLLITGVLVAGIAFNTVAQSNPVAVETENAFRQEKLEKHKHKVKPEKIKAEKAKPVKVKTEKVKPVKVKTERVKVKPVKVKPVKIEKMK
jgi:hypothetical protein